jgi:hypothetical protein
MVDETRSLEMLQVVDDAALTAIDPNTFGKEEGDCDCDCVEED